MKYPYRIGLKAWFLLFVFHAAPAAAVDTPIIMGLPRTQNDYYGKLAIRVYDEIFHRLGLSWKFRSCVPTQCGKYITRGELDGELARASIYQRQYPDLVQCDEPVFRITMAAFARKDIGPLNRREDFRGHGYIISYVTGYYFFDYYLKGIVPEKDIRQVGHWREGISKLMHNQADIFIGVERTIQHEIMKHQYPIHRVGQLASIDLYPYFNRKHKNLAKQMAKVIRKMKQEGEFQRLMRQASLTVQANDDRHNPGGVSGHRKQD